MFFEYARTNLYRSPLDYVFRRNAKADRRAAVIFADFFLHSQPSHPLRYHACELTAFAPLDIAMAARFRHPHFGYAQSPLGF